MSEEKKSVWSRIYKWVQIIGVFLVIPAGIAEFTGISLSDILSINQSDCIVPEVLGDSESMAVFTLKEAGLEVVRSYVKQQGLKEGIVVAQKPSPEETIKNCSGKVFIEINRISRDEIYDPEYPIYEEKGGFNIWKIIMISFIVLVVFRILEELN